MQLMFMYACLGQFYNWFHVLCMLGYQIFNLKFCSVFVLFGFLGKRLRTHNLAYACRLDYAHTGLFLHAQAVNQKPLFYLFVTSVFTCLCCLSFFSYVLCSISFCLLCSYACFSLICLDQGFTLVPCLNTMNMHSHVHAQRHRCCDAAR